MTPVEPLPTKPHAPVDPTMLKGSLWTVGTNHYKSLRPTTQKIIRVFFTCCAVLIALDALFLRHASFHEHAESSSAALGGGHAVTGHAVHFPYEMWFGFYCLYGFAACVLLVLVAKQLRRVLMRGERYYDRK